MRALRGPLVRAILAVGIVGTILRAPAQTLAGTGYEEPSLIRVAPGQVVSLFVTGLQTVLPQSVVRASTIPLPTTLAGLSVTLSQTLPSVSRALPIFSAEQFNHCASQGGGPSCSITAITVQIPFDISVPNPLLMSPIAQGLTTLAISENGQPGPAFLVYPVNDRVHVLRSCDLNGSTQGSGVCFPIVTHSDGTIVLQDVRSAGQTLTDSEAKPGEVVVIYAFGLGSVSIPVPAGTPSPYPPAELTASYGVRFDYSPNASPSAPTPSAELGPPLFAGLTPGAVGLYQINFKIPAPPAGTPNCGAPVESNLTVSVAPVSQGITAAPGSFDGAAFCVDVSQP